MKVSLWGNEEWQIPEQQEHNKDLFFRFDSLFLLQKSGKLIRIDSKYGYPLWVNKNGFKEIFFAYPYIHYLDHQNQVGTLDFKTGQSILLQKNTLKTIHFIKNTQTFMGIANQHLINYDPISKTTQKILKMKENWHFLGEGWKDHVLIKSHHTLRAFNYQTKQFSKKTKIDLNPNDQIKNGKTVLTFNSTDQTWRALDLITNQLRWEEKIESDDTQVLFGQSHMVFIDNKQTITLREYHNKQSYKSLKGPNTFILILSQNEFSS